MIDLFLNFFSIPGVGFTIGIIFASGMVIGTSMVYLGVTRKGILAWTVGFFILLIFIETVRLEIFIHNDEPYSIMPLLTAGIPFVFYVLGMIPGAAIAYHWCVDEKEVMREMLTEYERANGNAVNS